MILLDTHVLVWMSLDPGRLSKAGIAAVQDARIKGGLYISDITLWEIALLVRRGRIKISGTIDTFIHEMSLPMSVKRITPAIAIMAVQFPDEYPKDPADRLIGATSIVEQIPLVTADEKLRFSPLLQTIW
ncbi:MAG TPA: type II toxin-antitoxin system VapC family toxin [Candidatus Limnocylindrales bacterium]|nr:type II toxin-antitoxin system VapC family toxin [Candidatus Limnocylindrales bacterium]